MSFGGIVCALCGDNAHPDYVYRRMIGKLDSNPLIHLHPDCCKIIYDSLREIEIQNSMLDRFAITHEHWL